MRVLVTGAAGFAGAHLVRALVEQGGQEVFASDRSAVDDEAHIDGVQHLTLDVTDARAVHDAVAELRPERVFHLAGFAHVGKAEAEPDVCMDVNLGGTRHVLDAVRAGAPEARVLLVSSSEVYGRVDAASVPVDEATPLCPATTYALSKVCAEMAGRLAVARGLDVVILRPFNHIGPGQSDDFVSAAFAHQVARIEAGLQDPVMRVGNLEAQRDFSHVRDTVAAYLAAAERGRTGEAYNVTSGRAVAIRELLDVLLSLTDVDVRVENDPARMRASDVPVFHGRGDKLAEHTGWSASLDLRAALSDVLDYWRARARRL